MKKPVDINFSEEAAVLQWISDKFGLRLKVDSETSAPPTPKIALELYRLARRAIEGGQ